MAVILSKTGYEGNYMSTGNEYISLPRISLNGAINAVGFYSNEFDACLEFVGRDTMPLIEPYILLDNKNIISEFDSYELESYWIPNYKKSYNNLNIDYTIVTPITRKGFVCILKITNNDQKPVHLDVGYKGTWYSILETCKALRKLNFEKIAKQHSFEPSSITFNITDISNIYTMTLFWNDNNHSTVDICTLTTNSTEKDGDDICYNVTNEVTIAPGETYEFPIYAGIAKKEIASISIVKELIHQGHKNLLGLLKRWLNRHIIEHENPRIKQLINENSFYNFFFSQSITIDEDKLVIISARDSKSSYCGLYLDVDSMRWSQQAVQLISWTQARKHLEYAATVQSSHMGQRSRTINGRILDMGIQLDAICSPIIGLTKYVEQSGDKSILFSSITQNNINYIQRLLSEQFDDKVYLLETLISPDGLYSPFPYICMQNVIAWKTYKDLAYLYNIIRDIDKSNEMKVISEKIREDIYNYFLKDTEFGKVFCYATDLNGNYIFSNAKMLSFKLMTYLGFIHKSDDIYKNTIAYLTSIQDNNLKNNDIIYDIINHLIIDDTDHINDYYYKMIDENDSNFSLGSDPYAALSGLFTIALYNKFGGLLPDASIVKDDNINKEALMYRAPEVKLDSKKARIRG